MLEADTLPGLTFCIFVLTQNVCGPIVPASSSNFLRLVVQPPRLLFDRDDVVSVVEVRAIFISDVYSHITRAAAEDPVDGTTEESSDQ